ncbi:protein translocase subunit SecF [Alicyclobacillus cycloheptanicus]|uniref:Protein-export membrane protein SecF n=1 Tax=Alicyclobacillus cycloheptanicus TaxID=1457 RepID=A0ABT9XEK6_9BACL|nr:protein translocase subunit SecF [Alicyclobacillus cycloheptanicus]MDQ0188728.1 SecD/SecF fusion protein [Alicyclobacillus cycloheptanicus]WDM00608.1 protein translocase subunit SecF [Alicyclobacillus cycloheptanicus]
MKARFNLVRNRKWFFMLSGAITVAGLIVFLVSGFNLGTDFVAGSRVQLQLNQPVNTAKVQQLFQEAGIPLDEGAITTAGGPGKQAAVVRLTEVLTPAQVNQIKTLEAKMFPKSQSADISTVDPLVAKQTSQKAVWAVLIASLFIVIYVAIRFEYRFAISGIVALLHDAFIVMSAFALLRLEVDLTFVAAILTIVGYSINDTIVIFDRIRENLKGKPPASMEELEEVVNRSLWQTMTRSINTVATVLIAALMLYFFGGTSIRTFTFALIVGLVSGAYSSIFIASPLWVTWRGRQFRKQKPSGEVPQAN